MTLFADDPDVHVIYPITVAGDDAIDFTPIVKVQGFADITGSWVSDIGPTRDLRVPLVTLSAGAVHRLRLVVPGDNDVVLGDVVLATYDGSSGGGGTTPPAAGTTALIVSAGGVVDLNNALPDGSLVGYRFTGAATVEGVALTAGTYIFERDASVYGGWTYRTIETGAQVVPTPAEVDDTAPTAGTMTASAITQTGFRLTVAGAADETALHAQPYAFSTDDGSTWTTYQAAAFLDVTGLAADVEYPCRHRVRDAAGNVTTGPAVAVTTEADLPAIPLTIPSLAGWWDAADESTFTFTSGTTVSQWRDKSGLARHFGESTAGKRPSRSGTENGLPTIQFDGVDDKLNTAAFTLSQPMTLVVVGRFDVSSGIISSFSTGDIQTIYEGTGFYYYAGSALIYSNDPPKPSVPAASAHTYVVNYNGASSGVWFDGLAGVAGNPGAGGTTTGLVFGDRGEAMPMKGELCEVLAFSTALSPTDRNTIEDYLREKWGTP